MENKEKFNFKVYLYCIWLNKATFAGYILFLTGLVSTILYFFLIKTTNGAIMASMVFCGLMILSQTGLGYVTYETYMRCQKVLRGGKGHLFLEQNSGWCGRNYGQDYCSQVAIKATRKDYLRLQKMKLKKPSN